MINETKNEILKKHKSNKKVFTSVENEMYTISIKDQEMKEKVIIISGKLYSKLKL